MKPEEFMYMVDEKMIRSRYEPASDDTWETIIRHYPDYMKDVAMNVTISDKIKKMLLTRNIEIPEPANFDSPAYDGTSSNDDWELYGAKNWEVPFYKQNIDLKKKPQDSLESGGCVVYLRNIIGIKVK